MAGKNSKEKIGFKDLVTFAKAGWTPEETNALLDRLDAMGDPNDPDMGDPNDPDSVPDEDDLDDLDDVDNADDVDNDPDIDDVDDNSNRGSDNTSEGAKKNLDKMKALAYDDMKVENERLKNEIKKLRVKNRRADLSGQDDKKTNKESLIDAFQSCF